MIGFPIPLPGLFQGILQGFHPFLLGEQGAIEHVVFGGEGINGILVSFVGRFYLLQLGIVHPQRRTDFTQRGLEFLFPLYGDVKSYAAILIPRHAVPPPSRSKY